MQTIMYLENVNNPRNMVLQDKVTICFFIRRTKYKHHKKKTVFKCYV